MTTWQILDDIVVLLRAGGKLVDHDRLRLSELRQTLPGVGDRLTLHVDDEGIAIYRVADRYLVDLNSTFDANGDARFWVLVVVQDDDDNFVEEIDDMVRAIYRADFASVWTQQQVPQTTGETVKDLDRKNRDPAYWTFERKELLRLKREARLAAMKRD